jgi:capsular polysaccharide biosynthesis protein
VLAGLLGVALAAAVALIKDKTDTTVRSKEELEQLTDTKVLALLDA